MDIKEFLESSTIHGLLYIATTRNKLVKLFWIITVIAGFTGAGILINRSFQDWGDSPVKTTIETLPITQLTLPKVTVCPPKNTYTNLNYDLMMLENMTLDNDTRNELKQYAVGLIQEHIFKEVMSNLSLLEEENRYYNWYWGITRILLPYWGEDSSSSCTDLQCEDSRLRYYLETYATSGCINTKYFGDTFDPDKIEKNIRYTLYIYHPKEKQYYLSDRKPTMYYEMEKNKLQGFDTFYDEYESEITILTRNITTSDTTEKKFIFDRKFSRDDHMELKTDLMPGLRIKWSYEKSFRQSEPIIADSPLTNKFSR